MSFELTAADWIQLITASAAAIAATVAILQNRLTKQQLDSSLRPWIGAAEGGLTLALPDRVTFAYKNYGQLPCKSMTGRVLRKTELFSREELAESNTNPSSKMGVIHPDQNKAWYVDMKKEVILTALSGKEPLFIGISLSYTYADNRQGEYGVIYEFAFRTRQFMIREEWSE